MKVSNRTAIGIFAVMIILGIISLAGIAYLILKYTDPYPDDEKAFLWYNVRMDLQDSGSNLHTGNSIPARKRVVSYAYLENDCMIREFTQSERDSFANNYSYCVARPPSLSIDPERFIDLARARVGESDLSAEFRKLEYMTPEIAKVYLGLVKPCIGVKFAGKDKEYEVFYDARTGSEERFLEEPIMKYPICATTAERNDGGCTNLRFQTGDMVYSQSLEYSWQQALDWIKENTQSSAVIQTWWDYQSLCSVKSGRKCVPDSRDIKQIDDAATFYMSDLSEDDALKLLHENGVNYIIADWDLIAKGGALRYIASSKTGEGSYSGYASCYFSPDQSSVKQSPRQKANGTGIDMVNTLVFSCNNQVELVFDIVNGKYSADSVYLFQSASPSNRIPWKKWKEQTGSSILGVQSLRDILGNCLNYPDKYVNLPPFSTFVYLPANKDALDGNNTAAFMFGRLYFGEHLEEYKEAQLASDDIKPLEKIRLVPGFESSRNNSYYGYVKVFEVSP
jgi:hypothetical protein